MYIDLVLAKFTDTGVTYLYQAPAWSGLQSGNEVLVENQRRAIVEKVCTLNAESDVFKFLLEATSTKKLRKIIGKYEFEGLAYEEEYDGNMGADTESE